MCNLSGQPLPSTSSKNIRKENTSNYTSFSNQQRSLQSPSLILNFRTPLSNISNGMSHFLQPTIELLLFSTLLYEQITYQSLIVSLLLFYRTNGHVL